MNDMPALAGILQPVIDGLKLGPDGLGGSPINDADNVDKIILVSHLQQIALEQALAPLLDGVDVIVAGGSDTILSQPDDTLRGGDVSGGTYPIITSDSNSDPVAIVSTAGQYSYVGSLTIEFDSDGNIIPASIDDSLSGAFAADTPTVDDLWGADDPFDTNTRGELVMRLTDAVSGVVAAKDGNIVGRSGVFMEGRRAEVRTQETNFGNLTADANLAIAQTYDPTVQVSLKNGGGIRAEIGNVDTLGPNVENPVSGKGDQEVSHTGCRKRSEIQQRSDVGHRHGSGIERHSRARRCRHRTRQHAGSIPSDRRHELQL